MLSLPKADRLLPQSVNPYVIGRNASIWGDDVDTFRPDRWLRNEAGGETEEAFSARLSAMNTSDLTFGAGSRVCIGKNLGLVEVYKVVATLAARYDMELVHPDKKWKVINSWFMRQEGIEVKISRR